MRTRVMVVKFWAVGLVGGEWELGELAQRFGKDVRVERGRDGWELRCADFSGLGDAARVRDPAADLLVLINGVARLRLDDPDPVGVGNVYRYRGERGRDVFVFPEAVRLRLRAGTPTVLLNGVQAPVPSWESDLRLAAADERVLAVLAFLAEAPTWHRLYGAYETIESDPRTGAKRGIRRWAQVSENDLERLTRTANAYAVLGVEARHGISKQDPPPNPMERGEAEALVRHVARCWLAELANAHAGSDGRSPAGDAATTSEPNARRRRPRP